MPSPGDPLRKVQPGEKLASIPRDAYNAFIEVARAHRQGQFGGGDGEVTASRDPDIVLVRNTTGAPLDRFAVLEVADPLVSAYQNEGEFFSRAAFDGVTPTDADCVCVVLLEPLDDDVIGRAVVSGAVPVLLAVTTEGDSACAPTPGETGYMTSGVSGQARVIWVEAAGYGSGSSPVLRHAYVLLGSQNEYSADTQTINVITDICPIYEDVDVSGPAGGDLSGTYPNPTVATVTGGTW